MEEHYQRGVCSSGRGRRFALAGGVLARRTRITRGRRSCSTRSGCRRFTIRSPGGGSLPLEAQRFGLEVHASDLNPWPCSSTRR